MGEIVYKTLVRLGLALVILWFFKDQFNDKFFWIISFLAIFFIVINPAYISYKSFIENNKKIFSETLCSSCKQFDQSAVLCIKYDKHPTENFIPCEGKDWVPK